MVRPQICMDQQPGTAGWKPGTQWCCTAGCSCHQHPSQKWLFFGVIKAIPGSLATPNARLRIADFRGCTANRSVLCPVTIDSSSAVGVRNDPMKKKTRFTTQWYNDIYTVYIYIYIIIIIIIMIIISALEQLFCRKSSINCIHHSLSNWFGHFLPSGRVMSRSVVRTLGCQKSSQDRLRLKHQPLPELAWHFTLYDSLVSRGLADEWVPVLDGRDTKIQTNTQIIWSYLIYIGGPKRRNT